MQNVESLVIPRHACAQKATQEMLQYNALKIRYFLNQLPPVHHHLAEQMLNAESNREQVPAYVLKVILETHTKAAIQNVWGTQIVQATKLAQEISAMILVQALVQPMLIVK